MVTWGQCQINLNTLYFHVKKEARWLKPFLSIQSFEKWRDDSPVIPLSAGDPCCKYGKTAMYISSTAHWYPPLSAII